MSRCWPSHPPSSLPLASLRVSVKPSSPRIRTRIVFAAKVLVASLLIGWLIRSGHLDMKALGIFVERPWLLAMNLTVFMVGAFVSAARFSLLLGLSGVRVPFSLLLRLQFTALFFNVVIPGNVGGDVVKALYVARDAPKEKRTSILLVVFVERLIGLSALILVASLVTLSSPAIWANPSLRPFAAAVVTLGAGTLIGGALALVVVRRAGARLERYTAGPSKISKALRQLVASMRLLSAGPRKLLSTLVLSMGFHALVMGFFTVLTQVLLQQDVPYSAVASVFPLGLLTVMIPISPSGLGVGHVAFKRLFEAIGLAGGATVFNVYLLGQIAPCLLGVFPFLALRRQGELPTEAPEDAIASDAAPPG